MNKFKKNNKGFSLVELIVVIAIMAILVGVAVPVYSHFIDKANKNKDIQLVDEIKRAVELNAAADNWAQYGTGYIGTIVIKGDKTTVSTANGLFKDMPEGTDPITQALTATFGDLNKLSRSWDGWKSTLGTHEAQIVSTSSFCADNGNVENLMGDIQTLTNAVNNLLTVTGGDLGLFDAVGMDENWLSEHGISSTDYCQLANAVTLYVAQNTVDNGKLDLDAFVEYYTLGSLPEGAELDPLTSLAADYAYYESYVSFICNKLAENNQPDPGLRAEFERLSSNVGGTTAEEIIDSVAAVISGVDTFIADNGLASIAQSYDTTIAAKDAEAYYIVMKQIASTPNLIVSDKSNPSLYQSAGVLSFVNTYINLADILQWANVGTDDVSIVLNLLANGTVETVVCPVVLEK